jgi:hypothetical protein
VSGLADARHVALLRVLVAHEVHFVLVGGVALQLRGFSGATRDVDVTIATDDANAHRLDAALRALNARVYLPGDRGSAYHTDYGQLEVMRWTHGVGDYDAWSAHASPIELAPGLLVDVGSASDLLLSKEAAGRDKDADALPWIRAELLVGGALDPSDVRGPVAELPVDVAPDPALAEALGPRPTDPRGRGLWERGAQPIAEYCERWGVADDEPPLGRRPDSGGSQAGNREALDRQLARLRRLIERGERRRRAGSDVRRGRVAPPRGLPTRHDDDDSVQGIGDRHDGRRVSGCLSR